MTKTDETVLLLREIRDIQRQQLSLQKAQQDLIDQDKKTKNLMRILHMLFNLLIGVFTIGAFWYLYHTVYGSGLLGN